MYTSLFSLLMMAAESMSWKHVILRFGAALLFLLKQWNNSANYCEVG